MSEPETNTAEDLAGLLFDYFASGHSEGCRVDWEDVDQNELQESAKAEAEEFIRAQKPREPVDGHACRCRCHFASGRCGSLACCSASGQLYPRLTPGLPPRLPEAFTHTTEEADE